MMSLQPHLRASTAHHSSPTQPISAGAWGPCFLSWIPGSHRSMRALQSQVARGPPPSGRVVGHSGEMCLACLRPRAPQNPSTVVLSGLRHTDTQKGTVIGSGTRQLTGCDPVPTWSRCRRDLSSRRMNQPQRCPPSWGRSERPNAPTNSRCPVSWEGKPCSSPGARPGSLLPLQALGPVPQQLSSRLTGHSWRGGWLGLSNTALSFPQGQEPPRRRVSWCGQSLAQGGPRQSPRAGLQRQPRLTPPPYRPQGRGRHC